MADSGSRCLAYKPPLTPEESKTKGTCGSQAIVHPGSTGTEAFSRKWNLKAKIRNVHVIDLQAQRLDMEEEQTQSIVQGKHSPRRPRQVVQRPVLSTVLFSSHVCLSLSLICSQLELPRWTVTCDRTPSWLRGWPLRLFSSYPYYVLASHRNSH